MVPKDEEEDGGGDHRHVRSIFTQRVHGKDVRLFRQDRFWERATGVREMQRHHIAYGQVLAHEVTTMGTDTQVVLQSTKLLRRTLPVACFGDQQLTFQT